MAKNESGSGLVILLIILLVVGGIGVTGWFIYSKQRSSNTEKSAVSATRHSTKKPLEQTPPTTDTTSSVPKETSPYIHTVDITLQTEADISKLPDYTPTSFKTFMLEELRDNKPWSEGTVTLTRHIFISQISTANIIGGSAPFDKNGEAYPGGAPILWVLNPQDSWDEVSLNGGTTCLSKNGGKVYKEFAAKCHTYDGSNWAIVNNPNGSVASLEF